jgi:dihydrofolate reductase/uncharacterized protein YndB with AHSA1/START domain
VSRELRYERLIQASPARVFDLFTSAAGQREFYGHDAPGWVVDSRCELRVGGAWEIAFGVSPGELYRHRHVFEAIERPRRLLLATTETRPDGSRLAFTTEFTFTPLEGATLMTMVQSGFPSDKLRDEHGRGLPHAFDRLEGALSGSRKGDSMGKSVLYMSMSLDGFIAGPDDGPDNGLGTGGHRLHEWLGEPVSGYPHFDPPGLSGQVVAEVLATGAVVVGRKTFDYAGQWGGDHHGVPIFVPTRGVPPEPRSGWIHYAPDPATAMREAKAAAGDADVMVHGAGLAHSLLRDGLLDELEIHLIPVVLGDGRRLFGPDRVELELTRVLDAPGVTHLRYRVAL